MPTTRFKGETAGERLDKSSISDSDMLQLRHKPGTIEDADKGISKAQLLSCPFGVSDTAAATAAKAADLTDSNPDFTLVSGREVVVCFTTANTASNPTLNFAGSGAIPLYRTNGEAVSNWPADTWMHLKYFYATVGNTTIQRWILLSPILTDTIAAGNMNAVTSNAVATSNAMPVDVVAANNMNSVTSDAVYKKTVKSWGEMTLENSGSNVINRSNLYTAYFDMNDGSTIYYITGWIEFKVVTIPNNTIIFSLPKKAKINTRIIGVDTNTTKTDVYQFYINNSSKDVTMQAYTFSSITLIQFNAIIISKAE